MNGYPKKITCPITGVVMIAENRGDEIGFWIATCAGIVGAIVIFIAAIMAVDSF